MASSAAIANSSPRVRDKPRGTARNKSAMETITVAAAKKNLDDVLKSAARHPVTVTRNGKPAAVVISARNYRKVLRLLEELENRDDLEQMRKAEKGGYLTPEENAAFVREMQLSCGIE